jgi:hypothetical protein
MSQSRSHSKSSTGSGSGHRPRYYGFWTAQARAHRSVAVVDQSLRYASARRAKLGFWITFVIVSTYTDVVVRSVHGTGPIRTFLIGTLAGLAAGSVVFVLAFCWPAIRLTVHWAAELLALSALLGAYLLLTTAMTAPVAAGVLLLAVCGPLTYPLARRRLLALGWCVISRHRLRVCFAEFIHARHTDGRLPLILLARPTPAGERIWVWLRAGLCLDDLTDRFEEIAVATWATDAHAVKSERWAALIRVDLTRRNALAAVVGSPLTDSIPTGQQRPAPVPRPVFVTGLDLPDIPDASVPVSDPFRRTGTPPRPAAPRRPPATPPPATTTTGTDETADWI